MNWIEAHGEMLVIWIGAISTFAVYSILFCENKFYRFFEHLFLGCSAGLTVYIIWSQVLKPMWWDAMTKEGQWYLAFAMVLGSMFYFTYSKKHVWISRIIFGLFMGFAAGGLFREFAEIYMPQIVNSIRPVKDVSLWNIINVLVFYLFLFCSMAYFFFSFENKSPAVQKAVNWGRWFLMIGFGAIFGATVMGRMTLFIGRFNFLVNDFIPVLGRTWDNTIGKLILIVLSFGIVLLIAKSIRKKFIKKDDNELKVEEKE